MAKRKLPLRTSAPLNPATQGDRIRYARLTSNLSQQSFAAAIAKITKTKVDKSAVSKWESESTANPTNASLMAIQAVTGFSAQWVVTGKGEERARHTVIGGVQIDVLTRAVGIVFPDSNPSVAVAIGTLYDLILDAPDVSDTALARTAAALLNVPKK